MAWAAFSTLIVVMPMARAGLRLMPRSSRKTHVVGLDVEQLAGHLVEARVGLAHADLARLDDDVEQRQHLGHLRLAVDVPG